jgi:phosphoadenosine phosphosulfate reductase
MIPHTGYEAKAARVQAELRGFLAEGKRLFITSSFQTHSIPLLHLISGVSPRIPVFFLETNYHFPETLAYRDAISALLHLDLHELRSEIPAAAQTGADGKPLHQSDKNHCCHINKVQPMDRLLSQYDVWISGVRADQTAARKAMDRVMKTPQGTLRYHPMLDWTSKDIFYYRAAHQLPEHPLEAQGYVSIGCQPCTEKPLLEGDERSGRWAGQAKTECGLHTELIQK